MAINSIYGVTGVQTGSYYTGGTVERTNSHGYSSIFDEAKSEEASLTDTEQLQDDWEYFQELSSALHSSDTEIAQEAAFEINSLDLQPILDASEDANAAQANKNTEFLMQLKQEADGMASFDTSSNPFA